MNEDISHFSVNAAVTLTSNSYVVYYIFNVLILAVTVYWPTLGKPLSDNIRPWLSLQYQSDTGNNLHHSELCQVQAI